MLFDRLKKRLKRNEPKKYFGLNGLDSLIEHFVNYDNGFFVELGANDGLTQSNTAYFEKSRGWKGVLIEPSPNKFLECIKNRSEKNHYACAACVDFEYSSRYVDMTYANLMTISSNVTGDIEDVEGHVNKGKQFLRGHEVVFQYGALARTLNSILKEASAPAVIDLLSLDVEGVELNVLRGVDFNEFNFKNIVVETREIDRLMDALSPLNYQLTEKLTHHDYLLAFRGS